MICAEAEKLFPGVRTAVVKYAIDNFTARCLPPQASAARITEAARLAVADLEALHPYRVDPPFALRIELREPAQAGAAANIPGVVRKGSRTVAFSSESYREIYGAVEAIGAVVAGVK